MLDGASPRAPSRVPAGVLAAGLALLLAGAFVAFRVLPEWRVLPPSDARLVRRVRDELKAAGGTLGKARVRLRNALSYASSYERAFRRLGERAPEALAETGGAVAYVVEGPLQVPGAGSGPVEVSLAPDGSLRRLDWLPGGSYFSFTEPDEKVKRAREEFTEKMLLRLLGSSRRTGEEFFYQTSNTPVRVWPLAPEPGRPRESLTRITPGNAAIILTRELADPDAPARFASGTIVRKLLLVLLPRALLVLLVTVLLGVLLFRRRLSFRIALGLGALAFASMLLAGTLVESTAGSGWNIAFSLLGHLATVVYLVALWTVAESLLRDTVPGFTTSLDALVARRLGPRVGRAFLGGIGVGAMLAGARLLLFSAAAAFASSGVRPEAASFELPLFGGTGSSFVQGPLSAGTFVLFVALLRFVLPRPRADAAGAALYALVLSGTSLLFPWGATLVLFLVEAVLFLFVFRRFGFAALLVAAVSAGLFRETLAAGRFFAESGLPFFLGLLSLLSLLLVGFAAARRPEREDEAKVDAPEYVKRLESERRVKYEMDLLSRMQLALLPEKPPAVLGVDLAVRTVLATEAGGDLYEFVTDEAGELWIAAGDVSGHGYSCGIQGAMVKAALLSLAKAGRSPAEVLSEIDRVLRVGGRSRLFTSLALLRLDPKTGQGLYANAGHPFPLLVNEGRCHEVNAPGFPLGQGPGRQYEDQGLHLPPGGLLVFASDGLFEGTDAFDEPYGYQRPRAVLESVGLWRRPAEAIVEALFSDWRQHVGEGAPPDDTTVLAVKRLLYT